MPTDPIVEEVRAIRDAYARQFGYDLDAIFADLERRQRERPTAPITLPPRPAAPTEVRERKDE
ncbi:MAG: hypothetical protein FJ265_03690 [Planctomycetes bacterium]|nr:hypothetical protein [Planctomycetota bacterium]